MNRFRWRSQREGWRLRAEKAYGSVDPHRSPTLTASEIGSFGFCPQAWYLQRCRLPVTHEAELARQAGSLAHRKLGRQTDLVRAAGIIKGLLATAVALLLVLLAFPPLGVLP